MIKQNPTIGSTATVDYIPDGRTMIQRRFIQIADDQEILNRDKDPQEWSEDFRESLVTEIARALLDDNAVKFEYEFDIVKQQHIGCATISYVKQE